MICRLFFGYYKLQLYYERRMKVNVLQSLQNTKTMTVLVGSVLVE